MKILIIYENVPETTDMYVLDVNEKDWKWIALTHEHYVNQAMLSKHEKACMRLSKRLEHETKLVQDGPINVKALGVDHVVLTGFIM